MAFIRYMYNVAENQQRKAGQKKRGIHVEKIKK